MMQMYMYVTEFKWGIANYTYLQTSNIGLTLVCHKIVVHSDVVGVPLFILDLTHGFNGLGKDNCKTRRETFKFWDLRRLILERFDEIVLWQAYPPKTSLLEYRDTVHMCVKYPATQLYCDN